MSDCISCTTKVKFLPTRKLSFLPSWIGTALLCFAISGVMTTVHAQNASPSNWLYPNGNMEATRFQPVTTPFRQDVGAFILKWASPEIAGDVEPLIGNLKTSSAIPTLPFEPNELVAVVKDRIVVIDGTGRLLTKTPIPTYTPFIRSVSALFDTLAPTPVPASQSKMIMGLETTEHRANADGFIYGYVASYDDDLDSVVFIRRLSVNLNRYDSNTYGGVKPLFGRLNGGQWSAYSLVSNSRPQIAPLPPDPPYLRGLVQHNSDNVISNLLMPDVQDQVDRRVTLAPDVGIYQPAFGQVDFPSSGFICVPTCLMDEFNNEFVSNPFGNPTLGSRPYLFAYETNQSDMAERFAPRELSSFLELDDTRRRPLIRSYIVTLNTGTVQGGRFLVATEEYNRALDSASGGVSRGRSRIHLFTADGVDATAPNDPGKPPSFEGGDDHHWAVSNGDLDGDAVNTLPPFFPNNPGNELVVTQSSKEFAVAGSRLYVLRFRQDAKTPKLNVPGDSLRDFDTICSARINGYVAAIADLDSDDDAKMEVLVADRSKLFILRMRDYASLGFRLGFPFDTVRILDFPNETITNVAVADLEGDSYNDIVVTTFNQTYVFGRRIPGAFEIVGTLRRNPFQVNQDMLVCRNDSLTLQWRNLLRGQDRINLFFRHYRDTVPLARLDTIQLGIVNESDSGSLGIVADSARLGRRGRYILVSATSPDVVDSTMILDFARTVITVNGPEPDSVVRSGDTLWVSGSSPCSDSLTVEVLLDSLWVERAVVSHSGVNFRIGIIVPCMPFYRCDTMDLDSMISVRVRGIDTATRDRDTSDVWKVRVQPAVFPITINPPGPTAAASRRISWPANALPSSVVCDTMRVLISRDNSKTFFLSENVLFSSGGFDWNLPVNLNDSSAVIRLCCAGGCVRLDSLIRNIVVRNIQMVAPNPYDGTSQLEIVYAVPQSTTVTIRIYDQANRLVAEPLINVARAAGVAYTDRWDGITREQPIANGMYYVRLELGNGTVEVYPLFVKKP